MGRPFFYESQDRFLPVYPLGGVTHITVGKTIRAQYC